MFSSTIIALGFATVGVVSAQSGDIFHGLPISDTCKSSILSVSSSPVSACLDIPELYKVLALPTDQDWLDPASTWLNGVCGSSDCDSTALTNAVTSLVNACQPDLELIGYGALSYYLNSETVPLYFKTAKNALCVRDQSNSNSLCVRDLALKIKNIYGISYKPEEAYYSYYTIAAYGTDSNGNYPSQIVCDKCTLGIYNQIKATVPSVSEIEPAWNAQCGANFTSTTPKDVTVSFSQNSGQDNTNGASSLHTGFAQLASVILAGVFLI